MKYDTPLHDLRQSETSNYSLVASLNCFSIIGMIIAEKCNVMTYQGKLQTNINGDIRI